MKNTHISILGLIACLAMSGTVSGATIWTGNGSDTNFVTAENWDNGAPSATNPAFFNSTASITGAGDINGIAVTITAPVTVTSGYWSLKNGAHTDMTGGSLTLQDGFLTLGNNATESSMTISGGTLNLKSYCLLGQSGKASLTIRGDAIVNGGSGSFTIGDTGTSDGTLNLEGGTLTLKAICDVANHKGAKGTVNMSGGTLTSTSSIRVGGADSTDDRTHQGFFNYSGGTLNAQIEISTGMNTEGYFTVREGASLTIQKGFYVGNFATNAKAEFTLEAGSSVNNTSTLTIGNNGGGRMTISPTASLTGTGFTVGNVAAGNGTVEVLGTVDVTSKTLIGASGTGTLNVQSGASYCGTETTVGAYENSTGTVNVLESGTFTDTKTTIVGEKGTGAFYIKNGGTANVAALNLGESATGVGTVEISGDGSVMNLTGTSVLLKLGKQGTNSTLVVKNGGKLNYDNTVTSASMIIGDSAGSSGTLTIESDGLFTTGTKTLNRTIWVGNNGTGTMNLFATGETLLGFAIRLGNTSTGIGYLNVKNGTVKQDSQYVIVGRAGDGYVTISDNGKMELSAFYIGDLKNSGAHGELLVKDTGQLKVTHFFLADKNTTTAQVEVQAGGKIVAINTKVGYSQHFADSDVNTQQDGGSAKLQITGGDFTTTNLQIGKTSEISMDSGTLTVTGDAVVMGDSTVTISGGKFKVDGSFTQNDNSEVLFGKDATIEMTKGYTMTKGTIDLDVFQKTDTTPYLNFGQTVALENGKINLDFDDEYLKTLAVGAAIPLITGDTLTANGIQIVGGTYLPSTFWTYHVADNVLYADLAVPEPASWFLLLLMVGGILVAGIRRKKYK